MRRQIATDGGTHRNRKPILGVGAVLMLAAIAGCSSNASPRQSATVAIVGNRFSNPDSLYRPATLTVVVGTTVTWTDKDDSMHTVTPASNSPGWSGGSPILGPGKSYSHTFIQTGTYRYQCMVHPNMLGVVRVVRHQL